MGDDDSNGANPTTEPAMDQTSDREGVALPHTSTTWKVLGEISALDGIGVLGHNTNGSGTNKGVVGVVDSVDTGSSGVRGTATDPDGRVYGVRGETQSDNTFAAGVKALAPNGEANAVVADSTSGIGTAVRGLSDSVGRATIQATQKNDGTAILAENFGTTAPVLDIRPNSSTTSEGFGIDCGGTVNVAGQFFLSDRIDGSDLTPSDHLLSIENRADTSSNENAQGIAISFPDQSDTLGGANNFVTFRAGGSTVGAIEGDGSGGVTNASAGSDYAEWLPRRDPETSIEPGEVVGVHGGEVSLTTTDADRVMVVSSQPVVLGNDPGPSESAREGYEKVAFVGQAPTKVRGPIDEGDLVVPSGENDGIARAIDPAAWTPGEGPLVGQAWERDDTEGVTTVTVAIGIDDPAVVGAAVEAERDRIDRLEAENERLRAENADLRERLEAIETRIGMDDTPPAPADD